MTPTTKEALKPRECPFCAGPDPMVFPPTCRESDPYNPGDRLFPVVRCRNCYAEIPGVNNDWTCKSAIASWNDRPTTAPDNALVEALESKNEAYFERNNLVAALARLFPSGTMRTNIPGWNERWHGCVYIDLPTGQISYHYHDSQAYLFQDLPPYEGEWDGHDKQTVHKRLAALTTHRENGS